MIIELEFKKTFENDEIVFVHVEMKTKNIFGNIKIKKFSVFRETAQYGRWMFCANGERLDLFNGSDMLYLTNVLHSFYLSKVDLFSTSISTTNG